MRMVVVLVLVLRVLMVMRAVLRGMFVALGAFPLIVHGRVTMLMGVPMGMDVHVLMSVPPPVVVVRMRMDMFVLMCMMMLMCEVHFHGFFPLSLLTLP